MVIVKALRFIHHSNNNNIIIIIIALIESAYNLFNSKIITTLWSKTISLNTSSLIWCIKY